MSKNYIQYSSLIERSARIVCKEDKNEKLTKTAEFKRSLILMLLGIPMILVASLGKENIVCVILCAIYVILLFINGIVSLPFIIKNIYKKSKTK